MTAFEPGAWRAIILREAAVKLLDELEGSGLQNFNSANITV